MITVHITTDQSGNVQLSTTFPIGEMSSIVKALRSIGKQLRPKKDIQDDVCKAMINVLNQANMAR